MGSYEAGAASALRGLGTEPCGASCGYDDCGRPSVACTPNGADGSVAQELNPQPPNASPGVEDRIARLGSRYRARQGVRCETREYS